MKDRVLNVVCPLLTFIAIIVLWQLYLRLFKVPDYILPAPAAVLEAFRKAYGEGFIWDHLWFTLRSVMGGYAMGCGIGVLLGALFAESRTFERFFHPYVILLQSMPKVALAPLITVWFGFGMESKIAMVALICFFPVFVNTLAGIRQADPDLLDVYRAHSASRLHVFMNVKLPAAASSIFAGLQIAVVLGLIGAVVAEFVSSRKGLGTMIQSAAQELNTGLMLTGVFTLAGLGLVGNMTIRLIQRRVVFWEGRRGAEPGGAPLPAGSA
jgi:NitT/TauT family transport system permease protein